MAAVEVRLITYECMSAIARIKMKHACINELVGPDENQGQSNFCFNDFTGALKVQRFLL